MSLDLIDFTKPDHVALPPQARHGTADYEMRTRITGLSNENARLREAEQRRRQADLGSIEIRTPTTVSTTSTSPARRLVKPPHRTHSSFQDVIQSGISAFTGQTPAHRRSDAASKTKPRQESLGSLDEFEIDEEAFRLHRNRRRRQAGEGQGS
ncbi:M protein repeat protein [Pyrenophora tritici-repentis]|nr:M protein repeat protein [Pyrenophora tritici-repentis]